ncbi:MAG: hypothetical protein B7Y26_10155 [Hydrogenophilales bacterium 16-64-46]|nr:MAG: hypothetical protein B7Z32_05785 [Hydrogenophilales bacterium 12-64-13]OYZ04980.1 MAG: hypothetical protein B7Y26_10155 [Hydrogenophilales bacterium 16-64-46]OZA37624.1 MAG: hypothetical protein B7X87_10875 [Hydrogenophilales bacterium 17-64-34]HQT01080.1 DUF302 domain-containing protein [Thiobacillus sp.]
MLRTLLFTASLVCLPALAADPPAAPKPASAVPTQPWFGTVQTPYGPMLIQQALPPPYRDYQMNRILKPEEKKRWLQMAMPMMANMMQMDAREAMNYFAVKYQAKAGLSFDEVVESMMLRANKENLKFVGSNLMWKDFQAVLGDNTAPRVEVFSFCDIAVARDLLRIIPEMAVFLPCRITVMEDGDKNIWVLTLDWDVTWLDMAGRQMGITPELRQGALAIREKLDSVMRAGAAGEL